jgi:type VI secretion system protein ImpH
VKRELRDHLYTEPWSYGFFQAVRLLQRLHAGRQPVGGFTSPASEAVRFTVPTTLAFPASEVQSLVPEGSQGVQLGVNVFGLLGQQGVLPYWYSTTVEEAGRARNKAPQAFFDLFQHRMLALFYRAWEKGRPEVAFERGGRDLLEGGLRSIIGLGARALEGRNAVPDASLLFYAGLLGPTQRSALALEHLLEDFFALPVEVLQFSGGWFELDDTSVTRLGDDGPNEELGLGTVLGDAVFNQQAKVRIRVGPLSREAFEGFLPGRAALEELRELVRFHTGDSVEAEVQLVLRRPDVSGVVLGGSGSLPLGWGSWVCTREAASDKDDVVFSL